MAQVFKWNAKDGAESVLTTELNELADGANKITGSVVDNEESDELDMYGDFILYLATQGSARDANGYVAMYILPEVNSQFPYGGDALDPSPTHWVGNFVFDAATTARYDVIRGVLLPASDFHVLLQNETGQALAATLNTLYLERFNTQSLEE